MARFASGERCSAFCGGWARSGSSSVRSGRRNIATGRSGRRAGDSFKPRLRPAAGVDVRSPPIPARGAAKSDHGQVRVFGAGLGVVVLGLGQGRARPGSAGDDLSCGCSTPSSADRHVAGGCTSGWLLADRAGGHVPAAPRHRAPVLQVRAARAEGAGPRGGLAANGSTRGTGHSARAHVLDGRPGEAHVHQRVCERVRRVETDRRVGHDDREDARAADRVRRGPRNGALRAPAHRQVARRRSRCSCLRCSISATAPIDWLLARKGAAWGIRGLDDWASLPALLLLMSVFLFCVTPGLNALIRRYERQADRTVSR